MTKVSLIILKPGIGLKSSNFNISVKFILLVPVSFCYDFAYDEW